MQLALPSMPHCRDASVKQNVSSRRPMALYEFVSVEARTNIFATQIESEGILDERVIPKHARPGQRRSEPLVAVKKRLRNHFLAHRHYQVHIWPPPPEARAAGAPSAHGRRRFRRTPLREMKQRGVHALPRAPGGGEAHDLALAAADRPHGIPTRFAVRGARSAAPGARDSSQAGGGNGHAGPAFQLCAARSTPPPRRRAARLDLAASGKSRIAGHADGDAGPIASRGRHRGAPPWIEARHGSPVAGFRQATRRCIRADGQAAGLANIPTWR